MASSACLQGLMVSVWLVWRYTYIGFSLRVDLWLYTRVPENETLALAAWSEWLSQS